MEHWIIVKSRKDVILKSPHEVRGSKAAGQHLVREGLRSRRDQARSKQQRVSLQQAAWPDPDHQLHSCLLSSPSHRALLSPWWNPYTLQSCYFITRSTAPAIPFQTTCPNPPWLSMVHLNPDLKPPAGSPWIRESLLLCLGMAAE